MNSRVKLHFKDLDRFEEEYVGINEHEKELESNNDNLYVGFNLFSKMNEPRF